MRNAIRLALALFLLIACVRAQESEPAIDEACLTDVARPDASPPRYPVGSNECPYWYVPTDATPPELIEHPEPVYTGNGFFPGEAPSVIVVPLVSTEGAPYHVMVARAAAGDGLDQMAISAIKQWRWNPATRDGRPIAVMIKPIEVKFKLQGSSANPNVEPPVAVNASQTRFRDVNPAKYPLTIFVRMGGGLGLAGDGYRVTRNAQLLPASAGAYLRITCTGKNKGCSIPHSGNYPARWVSADRELEILTKVIGEDEWRAVEYDVELDTGHPTSSAVVHKNEHE